MNEIKILLSGCGRMGKLVAEETKRFPETKAIFGVDPFLPDTLPFPVVGDFDSVDTDFDVIVDYSNPAMVDALIDFAVKENKPLVLCTTGLSENQRTKALEASKQIPLFYSANMSLGIYLLTALAKKAATMLGEEFEIEIEESHHKNKLDAPSGTALQIAKAVQSVRPDLTEIVTDRYSKREKRGANQIGIASLRAGSIPGEHTLLFAGEDEVIRLTHTAYSPKVFATGALRAAIFLADKGPGLYDMSDLLGI